MGHHKRQWKSIGVSLVTCFCGFMLSFLVTTDFSWRYDKEWMIGKTREQIKVRYGAFDYGDYYQIVVF